MLRKIILTCILVSLIISGCVAKNSEKYIDKLTPEKLVETYYTSLSSGDLKTAKYCLSKEFLFAENKYDESDIKNIKKLNNLKVEKGVQIKQNGENFLIVQVVASYDAIYKKQITSNDGPQYRYLYVAQKNINSPWKIIDIGTGP